MTTKENNKGLIVYSVLTGFLFGVAYFCSMVDSFCKGVEVGFEDGRKNGFIAGRKKGLAEAHETIVNAYNSQS